MDVDTGAFQSNLLGSSHGFMPPKANSLQFSGGLMRYHSAPSSILAGLLDDDFFPAREDSEFARLLNDGIGSFSSLLDSKGPQPVDLSQPVFTRVTKEEEVYLPPLDQRSGYLGSGGTLSQSPLSSISEYSVEEPVGSYVCTQVPMSAAAVKKVPQQNHFNQDGSSFKPAQILDSQMNSMPQVSSGLLRQSSTPADFLSKLVIEENRERTRLGCGVAGPHLSSSEETISGRTFLPATHVASGSNFAEVKCSSTMLQMPSAGRSNALLRQSSSPAGLLSQINLEDFSMVHEKGTLASTSGVSSSELCLDRRSISGTSHVLGGWDESTAELAMQNFATIGQRKRGRVLDDKLSNGSVMTTPMQKGLVDVGNAGLGSIDSMEGSPEDSVLCKARAKRGCATHPRSIAERQRRIKISERMKKLQDLVPHLDKQANTAEMLDEVVEYVKLLQRQVQELSLNRPVCNGSCKQQGSLPQSRDI